MCLSHIVILLLLLLLLGIRSDLECNLILKLNTEKVLKSMTLGNNNNNNNNNNYYYYYYSYYYYYCKNSSTSLFTYIQSKIMVIVTISIRK